MYARSTPITIKANSANPHAFSTFHSGEAQAYAADAVVADTYVKQDSTLVLAGKPFDTGFHYGIAFLPTNTALRTGLQRALAELHNSGEYSHILSRWGVSASAL